MASQRLKFPDLRSLDPEQIVVRYVESVDTLFVHFYGVGQPGVSVQLDEFVYFRLDPEEERVIGMQIEAFLKEAVSRHPNLLPLAQFADIRPELMKAWRNRKGADDARINTLGALLEQWSEPATV